MREQYLTLYTIFDITLFMEVQHGLDTTEKLPFHRSTHGKLQRSELQPLGISPSRTNRAEEVVRCGKADGGAATPTMIKRRGQLCYIIVVPVVKPII